MKGINRVTIAGNLGADPVVRQFKDGGENTVFSVGVNEFWKDKASGEKREKVEWHRITVYGDLAGIAGRFLVKGSAVYVEGKLKTRSYTDKDGNEKWITEIRAYDIQFLDSVNRGGKEEESYQADVDFDDIEGG